MFHHEVARRCANILRARFVDAGLNPVQVHSNGQVTARVDGRDYTFRWNILDQQAELVSIGDILCVSSPSLAS